MKKLFSKSAKKSIERLDSSTKKRIRQGINELPCGDIKKLKKYKLLYRLRIGDWRIIFIMNENEIFIEDILPRGEAYKYY